MTTLTKSLKNAKFGRLRNEDLVLVQRELKRIEKQEGEIRPERVVEIASDPKHPLHRFIFRLSDKECAHKWRIEEARKLCRAVRIVFTDDDGEEVGNSPSLVSVVTAEDGTPSIKTRRYISIDRAYADPDIRRNMIAEALAEADAWARRHASLVELAPVFRAINQTKKVALRKKAKAS